jgi:hypothetical protein
MRKLFRVTMMSVLAVGLGMNLAGCSDEASSEKKVTEKGPGGTTVTTDKQSVKQTGENPPPAKAP